ncbi:MAG: K+-transporting ATPase, subunit [Parachlamydiales bacterium]|nr:K+-transporting ATPase, subunit [Parachlamydiales bacterium]
MIQKEIRTTALSLLLLTLILGIAYPLLICAIGRVFFPEHASGGLLENGNGQIIGSKFIGQNFSSPAYFHPRPSAAGDNGYDAMKSGGSNLGPTSKKLMDLVQARLAAYREENDLPPTQPIPVDAVTASGSGLDPHISLENAQLQASRIARERGLALLEVLELIRQSTAHPWMGIFGEKRINVLQINLSLDGLKQGRVSRAIYFIGRF